MYEKKLSVVLIQQGVWDMPLESMPLASGYIKATALEDDRISRAASISIQNFRGGTTLMTMATTLFAGDVPDVIGFSVMGWNYRSFGLLAETYKQLNPDGLVVFGGPHVAYHADRVFGMFPEVDVVVNGEGEFVFRDLLLSRIAGRSRHDLADVTGISFRDHDGRTVTTADRERVRELDEIPSPFLTNAIDMLDAEGRFRYDVAIMETNRGCPYKCAFCYWGGAVGQKVRAFSRERLRAELEYFAKLNVHTIVLCDSNFGMLRGDLDFVDDLIEIRDQYGFPRALETSWAKNKSKTFYEIVKKMKEAGMHSSFTLALQTLDDSTLALMNRKNMKVNDWEDLSAWLSREGLDCYAELIWGAPGETVESFMQGYDRLASKVSRIACYPMLMLPNTDYSEKKAEYGIISVRGDRDDFEYVLATSTVNFAENQRMQRFLFWARVIAEMAVLRHVWVGLRELAGITQSEALRNIDSWIDTADGSAALALRSTLGQVLAGSGDIADAVGYLYTQPAAKELLRSWWMESVQPLLPEAAAPVLDELFRFDLLTQPVTLGQEADLPVVVVRGEEYYVRSSVELRHDVPGVLSALRAGAEPDLRPKTVTVDLYYRRGAENAVLSTNHETIIHFMGMTTEQVLANASADTVERGAPAIVTNSNC